MTQTGGSLRVREIVRRQWIVVVVAVLIGLAAAAALARSETRTSWKASQTVSLAAYSGGITSTAKGEIVVTAVSTPSVMRAAEEELGLSRGALNGAVSSALATADKSTASITVAAPSKDAALVRIEAVTAAVVDYVLAPYEGYFAVNEETADANTARAKQLVASIDKLEKVAASVSPADRWGYYQAVVDAEKQRYDALTAAREARQSTELVRASVHVDPEPRTSMSSSGGLQAAAVVQGGLLGLIAGVAVALVREVLRARRAGGAEAS